MRPSTSDDPRHNRRAISPQKQDSLERSQLNLAAALLDTASRGTQLTEGQKAEVCPRGCYIKRSAYGLVNFVTRHRIGSMTLNHTRV